MSIESLLAFALSGMRMNNPLPVPEVGYSSDRFIDNMDQHICAICREVYRLPVSTNCGHSFCSKCLHKAELNFKNQCPSCRTPIHQSVPAFHLRMIIDGSQIRCMNHEYGCTHVDAVSRIEEHEVSCTYKHVLCNQCESLTLESTIDLHKKDTCPSRPTKCEECTSLIPLDEMKEHMEECPMTKVPCELCKEVLLRFLLPSHHADHCLQSIIPCMYHKYGCSFTCKRDEMKQHEEQVNHIPIICSTLDQKMEEWDTMLVCQLQNGPFKVAGHSHPVVLCSDLDENRCKTCKKIIVEKNGRYFGYHCANGCPYSLCLACFSSQRLFRSKRHNASY
jgi:hypothetical protein